MNKKQKGFTLTELIAVIVILVTIVLIAIPAYNAIRKRTLQTQYENTVSLIETAAVKYAAKNGTNITNVEELIKAGFLETDDGTNIFDPRDKSSMNCRLVEITYESGNFKTKLLEDDACNLDDVAADYSKIQIVSKGIETGTVYTNGTWVKENLELSIKKIEEIGDIAQYRWQSDSGQTSVEATMQTDAISILNTKVRLEVITTEGSKYYAKADIKIDKENPVINDVELTGGKDWTKSRNITITATDKKGSGIYGYYVGRTECNEVSTYAEYEKGQYQLNINITGLIEDTNYYVCTKDKVGNVTKHNVPIKIALKDTVPPTCEWDNVNNTEWTSDDVRITLRCRDGESGCTATSKKQVEIINYSAETVTLSKEVQDNIGNKTTCTNTFVVKVDKTAPDEPMISNPYEGNWTNTDFSLTVNSKDAHSGIEFWYYSYDNEVFTKYDFTKKYDGLTYSFNSYEKETFTTSRFTKERNQSVYIRVCDKVENCSVNTTPIKIDKKAPDSTNLKVKFLYNRTNDEYTPGNWTNRDVIIERKNLTGAVDNRGTINSGISHYEIFHFEEQRWIEFNASSTNSMYLMQTDGNKTKKVRAVDNAGNPSEVQEYLVRIDKTPPSTLNISNPSGGNWTNNNFSLTLSSSDTLSQIAYYQYSYNSNATTTGTNAATQWKTYSNSNSNNYTTTEFTAERNQPVYIRVCDNADNCIINSTNIKIDRTEPTCGTVNTDSNTQWTNSNRTVTMACTDTGSGCKQSSYSATYTSTTSMDSFTLADNARNTTSCNFYVRVDKTPPTTPTTMEFVFGDWSRYTRGNWSTKNVYVGYTDTQRGPSGSSDNHSGIARYEISSDNVNWETFNYDNSKTMYKLSTDGTHTRYFRAVDNAKNVSGVLTRSAKIDQTAPTTPTTMEFVFGDWSRYTRGNWSTKNVYVGYTDTQRGPSGSSDSTSGIARYEISSDNVNWETFNYDNSKTMYKLSTDGTHTRYFRAVDNAGKISGVLTRSAKIDQTAPTCGAVNTDSNTTWTGSNRTVTRNCTDTVSGCVKSSYSETYTSTKNMDSFTLADNAGNTTICDHYVRVDRTPPNAPTVTLYKGSTSSSAFKDNLGTIGNDTWTNKYIMAKPSGSSDNRTNATVTYYVTTSGTTTKYTDLEVADFKRVNAEGVSTVTFKACDDLDNCSSGTTKTIKIDKTAPTDPTTMEFVFGDWSRYTRGNWTKSNIFIANTQTSKGPSGSLDDLSGVSHYEISSDGTNWETYNFDNSEALYKLSTSGNHKRWFRAVDNAGNRSGNLTRFGKVDKTSPTISFGTNGNSTYARSHSTTVSASDDHAGLKSIKYGWSTSSTSTTANTTASSGSRYTTACSKTGNCYMYVTACDNLDNCTSERTNVFKIDKDTPTIEVNSVKAASTTTEPDSTKITYKDVGSAKIIGYRSHCGSTTYGSGKKYGTNKCSWKSPSDRLKYFLGNDGKCYDDANGLDNKTVPINYNTNKKPQPPFDHKTESTLNTTIGKEVKFSFAICDLAGNCKDYDLNINYNTNKYTLKDPSVTIDHSKIPELIEDWDHCA